MLRLLGPALLVSVVACGPAAAPPQKAEPVQESGSAKLATYRPALVAAEKAAIAMHAHDPGRFDEQLAGATALMTPSYAARFSSSQREREQLFNSLRAPVALDHVAGVGLIAGAGDEATVLLVGRVVRHAELRRNEKTLHTEEVFHLVREDGRWLVDDFEMQTDIDADAVGADPSGSFEEARSVVEQFAGVIIDENGPDDGSDRARLADLAVDAETARTWEALDTQLDFDGQAVVVAVEKMTTEHASVLAYLEGERSDGRQGPIGVWRCSLVRDGDGWKISDLELA